MVQDIHNDGANGYSCTRDAGASAADVGLATDMWMQHFLHGD